MHRKVSSRIVAVALLQISLATTVEASCAGPGNSALIGVRVVSCSVADQQIRERVERRAEVMHRSREFSARSVGASPKPLDLAGIEAEIEDRLRRGEVIVTLVVLRSLLLTDTDEPLPGSEWQASEKPAPTKYLARVGNGGCAELDDGKELVLFAPFQCCDTIPGSSSCMLGLPLALDVPEALLELSRSGV